MINLNLFDVHSVIGEQFNSFKNKAKSMAKADFSENNQFQKLISPSAEHLKARYISFGSEKIKEEAPVEQPSFLSDMLSKENLSGIKFSPYDKTAEQIAFNCFKGQNSMVVHENGAMPDLAVNSFADMLSKDKFKNIGMTKENTEVYFIDADTASQTANANLQNRIMKRMEEARADANLKAITEEERQVPDPQIKSCFDLWGKKASENKNVLIFVSDPTKLNLHGDGNKIKIISFSELEEPNEKNARTGGLSAKAYEIKNSDPFMSIVALNLAGAPETKTFLKANKEYFYEDPNFPHNFTISDSAIDEAVNRTKNSAGAYPGKALNFISDTLPAVLMKKDHVSSVKTPIITAKNITKAADVYPELFEDTANVIPDKKLKDVGGIEKIEDFVRTTITNKINKTGAKTSVDAPPESVLITGESGSGKTLLANAIAGETNSPLITVSALKLVDNISIKRMTGNTDSTDIQELFESAKNVALNSDNKTAFLYLDDFDAFVSKHSKTEGPLEEKGTKDILLESVLKEIQKLDNKNNDINVVVLASSEVPGFVQREFTKKGVFNTQIQPPDNANSLQTRISTIKLLTKDMVFEPDNKEKIINEAAKVIDGATGAELKKILNNANVRAERRNENKYITINDVYESMIELDMGPITQSEQSDWDNLSVIKHELGHAVAAQTLFNMSKDIWQKPDEIHLMTFNPHGNFGGFVSFGKGQNGMLSFDSLVYQMATGYASIYAEKNMFKGDFTSGPSMDLEQATHLAEVGVGKLAKGKNTGLVADPALMAAEVKKDVILLTKVSSKIAELVIKFNQGFIDEYGDECFKNFGKGGNTMSAEVFKNKMDQWLDKDNRREKLKLLEAKIEVLTEQARKKGEFIESPLELRQMANVKLKMKAYFEQKKLNQ